MAFDLEAARARAAAAGKLKPKAPTPEAFDAPDFSEYADTIPEAPTYQRTEFDQQMDEVIGRLDILSYYRMFCNKMVPDVGKKRESIMISCPKPSHRDSNPSAWINLDKQTWFCGSCQEGGDGFDIAAYNLEFSVPDYKRGKTFHELRTAIVAQLGYHVTKPLGSKESILIGPGTEESQPEPVAPVIPEPVAAVTNVPTPKPTGIDAWLRKPAAPTTPPEAKATAPIPPEPAQPAPVATVTTIPTDAATQKQADDEADEDRDFTYPHIDWRSFVPADTFLHTYMEITSVDDIPEEYNFWNGLAAIGLALGRNTVLKDSKPVMGNLFLCTIGASGAGKSQATGHFDNLMTLALPFEWDVPDTRGVRHVSTPASGEVLIENFVRELALDPLKPKELTKFPVKGYVEFAEFADLVARSARTGSTLSSTLMHFYDSRDTVSSASRSGGDLSAIEPFCTIISTTQLKSIRTLMRSQDASSGFLNRWVFSMGPAKDRVFFKDFIIDIRPAVDPLRAIVSWSAAHDMLRFSKEAVDVLGLWWKAVAEPLKLADTSDMFSRLDLLVKKLVLLFAANSREAIVSKETVEMVIKLFPYLVNSYNAVMERVGNTEEDEIVGTIMHAVEGFIELNKRPPSLREIGQRLTEKKFSADKVRRTIENLVALDRLEIVQPGPGPGRKSVKYAIPS